MFWVSKSEKSNTISKNIDTACLKYILSYTLEYKIILNLYCIKIFKFFITDINKYALIFINVKQIYIYNIIKNKN